jgi:hypothetical protein
MLAKTEGLDTVDTRASGVTKSQTGRLGGTEHALARYRSLVEQSMEELRLKTAAHDDVWSLGRADWRVDQEAGTIVFSRPGGTSATCSVQIIGTYSTTDGTWLWAWDHPAIASALQQHARQVRSYGKEHAIERLTTRKLACEESEAWEFTALACKLGEAQGAYRGPTGDTLVFMTFDGVRLSR